MIERLFGSMHSPAPVLIEGVQVNPDPATAEQIQRKIAEAKSFLGEKYLLHPSQQVQRKAA
jgi:hypothetical protein